VKQGIRRIGNLPAIVKHGIGGAALAQIYFLFLIGIRFIVPTGAAAPCALCNNTHKIVSFLVAKKHSVSKKVLAVPSK
jgi:hypothetical protein